MIDRLGWERSEIARLIAELYPFQVTDDEIISSVHDKDKDEEIEN